MEMQNIPKTFEDHVQKFSCYQSDNRFVLDSEQDLWPDQLELNKDLLLVQICCFNSLFKHFSLHGHVFSQAGHSNDVT